MIGGDASETFPDASELAPDANVIEDAGTSTVPSSLSGERDRVIQLYSAELGLTVCETWNEMDDAQRGVFLTITDLLGKRSPMMPGGETALSHVTRIFAIVGARSGDCIRCCGHRAFNRIYFGADDALIEALRNDAAGLLPTWEPSSDNAGPHEPFTQSSETTVRRPTGQTHFFASDADVGPLDREPLVGVSDPHMVEIDLDFNTLHDSNPECTYGSQTGRELYESVWSSQGEGGSPEFDYVPSGC